MKIVRRKEFLALPVGTVFMYYEPCVFDGLYVKGESITNDWFEVSLVGSVDGDNSSVVVDRLDDMEKNGASHPAEFDCEGRNGLYEADDRLYAIYEKADVERLIARLQLALTGESVYTIEAKKRKPT